MTSGKRLRCDGLVSLAALLAGAVLSGPAAVAQGAAGAGKFEVSFPAAVHGGRITGRVFVFLAKKLLFLMIVVCSLPMFQVTFVEFPVNR